MTKFWCSVDHKSCNIFLCKTDLKPGSLRGFFVLFCYAGMTVLLHFFVAAGAVGVGGVQRLPGRGVPGCAHEPQEPVWESTPAHPGGEVDEGIYVISWFGLSICMFRSAELLLSPFHTIFWRHIERNFVTSYAGCASVLRPPEGPKCNSGNSGKPVEGTPGVWRSPHWQVLWR